MSYNRSDMLYNNDNYYKWKARANHDNPYYTQGKDHSELNRTEGYEVQYFIEHLKAKHWPTWAEPETYQKIERMIRYKVPDNIHTHKRVADWIVANWDKV